MDDFQALIEKYNREMMEQFTVQNTFVEDSISEETDQESVDTNENALTDIGQLQIRVTTENQAIPIPEAVITITKQQNNTIELIRTVLTDLNGSTPLINLPTKDRRLSTEPQHPNPFETYTIDVSANGYFPKRFTDLPIYGGVTAVQNISMIPLPEQGDDDRVLIYPQGGPVGL